MNKLPELLKLSNIPLFVALVVLRTGMSFEPWVWCLDILFLALMSFTANAYAASAFSGDGVKTTPDIFKKYTGKNKNILKIKNNDAIKHNYKESVLNAFIPVILITSIVITRFMEHSTETVDEKAYSFGYLAEVFAQNPNILLLICCLWLCFLATIKSKYILLQKQNVRSLESEIFSKTTVLVKSDKILDPTIRGELVIVQTNLIDIHIENDTYKAVHPVTGKLLNMYNLFNPPE